MIRFNLKYKNIPRGGKELLEASNHKGTLFVIDKSISVERYKGNSGFYTHIETEFFSFIFKDETVYAIRRYSYSPYNHEAVISVLNNLSKNEINCLKDYRRYLIDTYCKTAEQTVDAFLEKEENNVKEKGNILDNNYRTYKQSLDLYKNAVDKFNTFKSLKEKLIEREYDGTFIYFRYYDVIAKDIQENFDDIYLGDLVMKISLHTNDQPKLISGISRQTLTNIFGYHPHDLSSCLCFGNIEQDIYTCIAERDLDTLDILLHKFLTTFNSKDSAGKSAANWPKIGETNQVFCSRENVWHSKEKCVQDLTGEYILKRDAVKVHSGEYAHKEDVIKLANSKVVYKEQLDDIVEIDGGEYHISDTVEDISGNIIVKKTAIYSEALKAYLNPKNMVVVKGLKLPADIPIKIVKGFPYRHKDALKKEHYTKGLDIIFRNSLYTIKSVSRLTSKVVIVNKADKQEKTIPISEDTPLLISILH